MSNQLRWIKELERSIAQRERELQEFIEREKRGGILPEEFRPRVFDEQERIDEVKQHLPKLKADQQMRDTRAKRLKLTRKLKMKIPRA